jgi:hypothetical protein
MGIYTLRITERLGTALGWLVAPLFALTSALRRARTFHPDGDVFTAVVTPSTDAGALGERLRGSALVRFSGALWKGEREFLDVLGIAVRLRRTPDPSAVAAADDQDLLFATIRRPWTMLLAPFTTDAHDFLANDYFGVSPFEIPNFGRGYLRLRPAIPSIRPSGASRDGRLRAAVARGEAALRVEVRGAYDLHWREVAVIALREHAPVDQQRLRFWPYRMGRGITPRGFVHSLRRGVYTLSQRARPDHEG